MSENDDETVTVLDFYATWCGPCKTQDSILEDLEEALDEEYGEDNPVVIHRINVDENREVANAYEVRSLPTVVVQRGTVDDPEEASKREHAGRFVGVTQEDEIHDAIMKAMA